MKWQLPEPQREGCTPCPACYQHFKQGKRSHHATAVWSKGGLNDTTVGWFCVIRHFQYNFCCKRPDVADLLPQVALDMVAGTMVGAASHRAMWHTATLEEDMRTVTGSAPAFSGHFSRLRVFFCGGFRFSIKFYEPFIFRALVGVYSFYCVSRPLVRFSYVIFCFCARHAGKGCQRSAVFYFMKISPEYFTFLAKFLLQEPKLIGWKM